jgi:hypothetical protein
MRAKERDEERAIERLIAEIDELDTWRDRIGRRVIFLFLATFVFALGLLIWVLKYAQEHPPEPQAHPGPKAGLRRAP